jgi:magnesium chelatase subunit H
VKISAFYVGSSLLAPLKNAERSINDEYRLDLTVATYNLGASLTDAQWSAAETDISESAIVFVFHVIDGENSARLVTMLKNVAAPSTTIVVINCMGDLMRCTRMGGLSLASLFAQSGKETKDEGSAASPARRLFSGVTGWMGEQARAHRGSKRRNHTQYLRYIERLPALLKLVPAPGRLRDAKHYLNIFCYFLQPTPSNIRSMLLYALRHYGRTLKGRNAGLKYASPESLPAVAIYHPDSPELFESFEAYRKWYARRWHSPDTSALDPRFTIGLLLMRPQIVSNTRKHYDGLIRALEDEGLSVIPAISTFMDNRESCRRFFVDETGLKQLELNGNEEVRSRVSQIISLTGFSFVGGPAMNDSEAALQFLRGLNRPLRSMVSLDIQTIESWDLSQLGLNPVQTGMQVAIPEIDGATEPFVFGGLTDAGPEPVAIPDRCQRIARRIKRWNVLRTASRSELKLGVLLFCFPPDKGNIGTAAELDVFPSLMGILLRLKEEGYSVEVPSDAGALRSLLIEGNSGSYGAAANVAYSMSVDEYYRLCPYARDIEREWGSAPGQINSFAGKLLIQGVQLGNVFVGVQPTFGYEGDPMRMLMSRSGSPHHGFMALYTYLEKVFRSDALLHVGTHGALEFMPGKQAGLSRSCWPDRLIGELPNIYLYSVNNPSEGAIAKRRSYAELVSYLTPPIESAGLYKDLAALKELVNAYRLSTDEQEQAMLFGAIEALSQSAHLSGVR